MSDGSVCRESKVSILTVIKKGSGSSLIAIWELPHFPQRIHPQFISINSAIQVSSLPHADHRYKKSDDSEEAIRML